MTSIERYGIQVGQYYERADGTDHVAIVTDTTTFSDVDDVVVRDVIGGHAIEGTRRIDAFKLSQVRYSLIEQTRRAPLASSNKQGH